MASNLTTFFDSNAPRAVQFHVPPQVSSPQGAWYVADHNAGGALLEWRGGGYPAEVVFVPWASRITIKPL